MRIKCLPKMAENTKCRPSGTIAFTLPISCQICLGKVKAPVVCPNQHVFCEPCLDVWLQRNPHCPACRAPINDENPCRKVLGGLNQGDESMCESFSNPELRRARLELLVRDYEDELDRLQSHLVSVETENKMLKERVQRMSPGSDSGSDKESKNGRSSPDVNVLLVMTKKLQDANSLYEKAKKDASRLKEKNRQLTDENINLVRENQRLRIEIANRSPMKFGRFTVAAMQSKIDTYEKEVKQLQKALEKSDAYIEEMEKELQAVKQDDPTIFKELQARLHGESSKEGSRTDTCRKNLFSSGGKTRKDADNEVKMAEKVKGSASDSKVPSRGIVQLGSWRLDHPDGQPQGKSTPQCSKTSEGFEESRRTSTFITGRTSLGGRTDAKHMVLKGDGSFDLELPSPITPTVPLSRLNIKDSRKKEPEASEGRSQIVIDGKEFELPLPEATRNLDDDKDEDSSELPPVIPGLAENEKVYDRSASRSSSGSSGPPTPTRRFPVMGITASYSIGHSPGAREGSAPGVGYSLYSGDETQTSPSDPPQASGSGEGPSGYHPGLNVFSASGEPRRRSNGSTGLNSYNATAVLSLVKSGPPPVPDSTTDLETKTEVVNKNESVEFDSSITPEFSDCLKILNEAEKKVGRRKQEVVDHVDGDTGDCEKYRGEKTEDCDQHFGYHSQTESSSSTCSTFEHRSSSGSSDNAARIVYGKKCNPHLKSMCDMDGNRRFSFGGKLGEMRQNLKHFLRRTPEKRKRSDSGANGEDPVPCSPAKKVHH